MRQAEQGFTILEVLLAVSILAIVSFSVGISIQSTVLSFEAVNEQTGVRRQARIAWQRFNEDLEAVIVHPDIPFIGQRGDLGGERADQLRFASLAHLEFKPEGEDGGLAVIRYLVKSDEDDPEQLRLIRVDTKYLPGSEVPEETEETEENGFVLCDHLKSFSLTYVDADGNELETWDSSQIKEGEEQNARPIPKAVRMNFVLWTGGDDDATLSFQSAALLLVDDFSFVSQ